MTHREELNDQISRGRSKSASDSAASSFSDDDNSRKRRRKKGTKEKGNQEHRHRRRVKKESDNQKKESRRKKRSYSGGSSEDERQKRKRLYKEAKQLLKKHELGTHAANGVPSGEFNGAKKPISHVENISDVDYYLKNNEFSMWLKEDRGVYFSDLSSDDTHRLFNEFVEVWNACRLSNKYYEGISRGPRTSHNWAIKDQNSIPDEEEKFLLDWKKEKTEQKKYWKEQAVLLDELLPKETGRERIFEKRTIRKEMIKARDNSPEMLSEKDILGGGDDIQKRLAQEKARREMQAKGKSVLYNEKFSAYMRKEAAAMDQIRALVDSAGGKIIIPKRNEDA
ncbi:hypothetical protein O6H91_10G076000 [Diphasiastrum complanatum]|uniref:Uncharacterized protein n=2 Tax=Diphasiastrum complanatum TaxID=34168 RepID=A0ACC2CIL8_DIPCM|nr:hypothetical protein O6H91_10G076000 [Diphasiastrum complanatum]